MKFFVSTTQRSVSLVTLNAEEIRAKQEFLIKMKESGLLEAAYVKIGGGSVYIVHAESFSDVRTAFRESDASLDFDCDIREIKSQTID